jgi:hypothetical protein
MLWKKLFGELEQAHQPNQERQRFGNQSLSQGLGRIHPYERDRCCNSSLVSRRCLVHVKIHRSGSSRPFGSTKQQELSTRSCQALVNSESMFIDYLSADVSEISAYGLRQGPVPV